MNNVAMVRRRAAGGESLSNNIERHTRIGEMAREFGVTLRTLRFYEDKGLISPRRIGTTRLYTHRDRARLQLVLLGRKIGFPLRDIKEVLDLYDPDGTNVKQLKVVLQKSQRQMARLEKQYKSIEEAVTELNRLIADINERLAAAKPANANKPDASEQ